MPGSGQFVDPVQVEVDSSIGADVANDGTVPVFLPPSGLAVMGMEAATTKLFILRTDAIGRLLVVGAFLPPPPPAPGTVITSPADTPVPVAATVALPLPPLGTRRMRVQVTGGSVLTIMRVRETGGAAGTGIIIIFLGSTLYGGSDGAIAPLEVENVAGPAATVAIQFEG